MKLEDLFEDDDEFDLDATKGAGYSDDSKPEKGKLSTYLLRRKAEKNNPVDGDDTRPDDSTTADMEQGDDPDNKEKGAGLKGGPSL